MVVVFVLIFMSVVLNFLLFFDKEMDVFVSGCKVILEILSFVCFI